MGVFVISPLPPFLIKTIMCSKAPSLHGHYPASSVSGRRWRTSCLRAGHRPPLKRGVQFSRATAFTKTHASEMQAKVLT